MNKRRASRELALITFSQLEKGIKKTTEIDIGDVIQKSSVVLTGEAENNLNSAVQELAKIREFVQNYELEHPVNLEISYEMASVPVGIPLTSDMLGRIDMLLEAAEKTYSAIDLIKLVSFGEIEEVKSYAIQLVKTFIENREKIDNQIKEHSIGWDVERLVKIDRDILRIAIAEIMFFKDVPSSVSIDEAVELAKKYSEPESSSFINGILGHIVRTETLDK
ncbi:MAG TPA: transcription antitermination factor NusB [Candidatus Gastranaerophilales bacterium]|nr:transcription antitermination factor NusB [Candidatus Gastranaerophilales bacterium]